MVNMKALMDSIAKKTAALSRTSAQKKAGKAATSATQTSTGKGVTYTYKS
jgi:flagellar hook assembly protein FlgD